jgi:prolyl 4-hydroxylase
MRSRCLVIVTLLPLVWMDALPAEWKAATLFENGKLVDGKGIVLTRETSFEGPRLYNSNGIKINSFDEVENNTDIFSLQSEEEEPYLHFMWPARYVGHKVEVQNLDRKVELETINLSPRVFYVHNFMSAEEADALVAFAQDTKNNPYSLRRSTTGHKSWTEVTEEEKEEITSSQRTSENGFVLSTPAAQAVKKRAFDLLRVSTYDEAMADGIQVLRYNLGQAYIAHTDFFPPGTSDDHNWDSSDGGTNRLATLFLYLSDVEEGGQTVFPRAEAPSGPNASSLLDRNIIQGEAAASAVEAQTAAKALFKENSWQSRMVDQCYSKLAVLPRKVGDCALLMHFTPPHCIHV